MLNVLHVSHEAVHKMGGIGAVLEGLITSQSYTEAVNRTIMLCPLFSRDGDVDSRLGPDGDVLYSSIDNRTDHPLAGAFQHIQHRYNVDIIYGRRLIRDALTDTEQSPEVILIDVKHYASERLNELKARFYERFGIESARYEGIWDYEQYMRIAEPGLDVVKALGAAGNGTQDCVVLAHEFMGMPTALAATLRGEGEFRTAFHAHEVSPIRKVVEDHSGHDAMFYNVLRRSRGQNLYITDVFGDQSGYFRHALVEASKYLDVCLAVGDFVVEELKFLSPGMDKADVRLAYNGIPAKEISPQEAEASKRRVRNYVENLLEFRPDYVFTHVTRMTPSKGLWRDLEVMRHVEKRFQQTGKTGVLIVLSTEIGGPRKHEEVLHMEKWWDWPVAHREGLPDLSDGEALFYAGVQSFNARARNTKVIFINQFGFERIFCGNRMPEDIDFWDIRKGSDVEFGQSIYEPFGIAQLEALSFGSICVMTNVCGCTGFAERVAGPDGSLNYIVADYTQFDPGRESIKAYKEMTREQREVNDAKVAAEVAAELLPRLDELDRNKAAFIRRGYELARQMTWDVVAREYILPAMRDITVGRRPASSPATAIAS